MTAVSVTAIQGIGLKCYAPTKAHTRQLQPGHTLVNNFAMTIYHWYKLIYYVMYLT